MTGMYAMRRANGDWFAFDDHGHLRVPVFRSNHSAMQARARNTGMLLFKPVILDERALDELAPVDGEDGLRFWLAGEARMDSNHGYFVDRAQLALLIQEFTQQPQG